MSESNARLDPNVVAHSQIRDLIQYVFKSLSTVEFFPIFHHVSKFVGYSLWELSSCHTTTEEAVKLKNLVHRYLVNCSMYLLAM